LVLLAWEGSLSSARLEASAFLGSTGVFDELLVKFVDDVAPRRLATVDGRSHPASTRRQLQQQHIATTVKRCRNAELRDQSSMPSRIPSIERYSISLGEVTT
jgi:hypothetical protein